MNVALALKSLCPLAEFIVDDNSLSKIVWMSESIPKPTEAEIQAEITRLQADYEAKQYQRDRAAAYPSIADQLDLLYHQGYDGWKAAIDAVKQEYPKP